MIRAGCVVSIVLVSTARASAQTEAMLFWPPSQREAQLAFESVLNSVPTAESLCAYHELLGSEPHIAGTPGDQRNIARQIEAFTSLGLETHTHEFWAYLATPVDARLEIISYERGPAGEAGNGEPWRYVIELPLREDSLPEDPHSAHQDLTYGWNAYSGSGEATGEIVYANYGTKEDFGKLRELGVEVTGKIVLARYGRNFRGYKAKFAEEAGAAGLVIFTDPDDDGYRKGVPYPEGGWANDSYIQRGSIKTLSYPGDPLTPGRPAAENAQRLSPDSIDLPRIPVQPVGYRAAGEIMQRMKGTPLPPELVKDWQGGLPCAYRLTGGADLKLRLFVEQTRSIEKSANVIATLPGAIFPDQKIIIGCHHDAWGCGAGDPLAGTMLVFEAARSFAEAARQGHRPARTIVFATWGAEEYGIIGSTEYCEQFAEALTKNTVAYINLDMAAMGPKFNSSASPSLKTLIEGIAKSVPQARSETGQSVDEAWRGERVEPEFGNLGGGSDHIGFYCHLGIPSCHLGSGGAHGVSYHSNYDTLAWYRHVVGEDYEPALMLARLVNLLAARLANSPLLPLDPVRYGRDFKTHLEALEKRAKELGFTVDVSSLGKLAEEYQLTAQAVWEGLLPAIEAQTLTPEQLNEINATLIALERQWLHADGLAERPWFRNFFAASDPDAGYAAWMLPALRHAVERKDSAALANAEPLYRSVFEVLTRKLHAIDRIARPSQSR